MFGAGVPSYQYAENAIRPTLNYSNSRHVAPLVCWFTLTVWLALYTAHLPRQIQDRQ